MIICWLFHCRMQEFLKAERQMSNKRNQFVSHFALRRVFKSLSYLLVLIFACGCSQLPIEIGVERSEIAEESTEETGQLTTEIEVKQSESEEGDSNPFDMDLSEDQRKQSELDSALRRLVKDLEQAMQEANEGISANSDGTYLVKRGDYLDKIISSTVGNYPFKRDILRKAFVQSNPKVFRRSNPNWMYANKTMRIPGVEDIKRVIFKDQPDNKSSAKDPYEGWVRYP